MQAQKVHVQVVLPLVHTHVGSTVHSDVTYCMQAVLPAATLLSAKFKL